MSSQGRLLNVMMSPTTRLFAQQIVQLTTKKARKLHMFCLLERNTSNKGPVMLKASLYHDVIIFNTSRPRQNGRHFADDIFKCIFLNENARISLKRSLKFVPKLLINNIPALVQIMAWRRPGDKPLSEAIIVNLSTHICVSRPQWVNGVL